MTTISSTVSFDETKKLQDQTQEFQSWLYDNCFSKINDTLKPDLVDAANRPAQYTFIVDTFTVILSPIYQIIDPSNWALSRYDITIKTA